MMIITMVINNSKCQDICVFDEDNKVESTSPSALFWPDAGSFSSQGCVKYVSFLFHNCYVLMRKVCLLY